MDQSRFDYGRTQEAEHCWNPFGQVPVLVDGDVTYRMLKQFWWHLARQYGGEEWLPLDAPTLAQVIRWLSTRRVKSVKVLKMHGSTLFGAANINIERTQKANSS